MSSPQISETWDLQDPMIIYNNRRGPSTLEVGGGNGKIGANVDFSPDFMQPSAQVNGHISPFWRTHPWIWNFRTLEPSEIGTPSGGLRWSMVRCNWTNLMLWFYCILLYCIVLLVLCFTEVANHFGIVWCRVHLVAAQPWTNLVKHGHN